MKKINLTTTKQTKKQEHKDPVRRRDNPVDNLFERSPITPLLEIGSGVLDEEVGSVISNDVRNDSVYGDGDGDGDGDLMSCAVPLFGDVQSSSPSTPSLSKEESFTRNPLRSLDNRMYQGSPGEMLETCMSGDWSDSGASHEYSSCGSKRKLSRAHSAVSARSLRSFRSSRTNSFRTIPGGTPKIGGTPVLVSTPLLSRSRSFGSTTIAQATPPRGWGRSKTTHFELDEPSEDKDDPLPHSHSYPQPKQRALDHNRPPVLDRRHIITTDALSEDDSQQDRTDKRSSDEDEEDVEGLGRTGKQQTREHDDDGGCQLSDYAMCLKSSKLIVPRASKDTALMYGKGRFHNQSNYAYAPHPKVFFEERGRKTGQNTLFHSTEEQSSMYRKHLTQPPQFFDTNENQREHTSTHMTHLSFLQPVHVLFTQKAACLIIHGSALYNLWKTDLHARHAIKKDEPEEPKLKRQQSDVRPRKKRGLSLRKPDRFKNQVIECRTEKIVSVQIAELVCVYVLALKGDSIEKSTPYQVKSVVQNMQLLHSVRSAGM